MCVQERRRTILLDRPVTIGGLMDMVHKFAPAQQLAHKAFGARQRNLAFSERRDSVGHNINRSQKRKVQRRGRERVEQVRMCHAHRILPWSEVRQHFAQGKLPGALRISACDRNIKACR